LKFIKKINKNIKYRVNGINMLLMKIAITLIMSPFLFTGTAAAQQANDLGTIINNFLTALQGPLRIGAGLGLLFGMFQLVMSFKEDNPQAKSSAIKFLIGAAALYLFAENFIDWIGLSN
jgi:hypothetical protein